MKANAVVRVSYWRFRVFRGHEEVPIPLLSQLEGVINAQLRGNGATNPGTGTDKSSEGSQLVASRSTLKPEGLTLTFE